MNRKRNGKVKASATPVVVEQPVSVSFQNLGIEWAPKQDGSAELRVAYEGPLASRDEVVARAGTWREGSGPWAETRELPLRREGTRWIGTIPVASRATVQAVEFVFRAADEWDNGGRAPLGYYEWNPHQRRVEVR
jgi:hypothetical protein